MDEMRGEVQRPEVHVTDEMWRALSWLGTIDTDDLWRATDGLITSGETGLTPPQFRWLAEQVAALERERIDLEIVGLEIQVEGSTLAALEDPDRVYWKNPDGTTAPYLGE